MPTDKNGIRVFDKPKNYRNDPKPPKPSGALAVEPPTCPNVAENPIKPTLTRPTAVSITQAKLDAKAYKPYEPEFFLTDGTPITGVRLSHERNKNGIAFVGGNPLRKTQALVHIVPVESERIAEIIAGRDYVGLENRGLFRTVVWIRDGKK
jgi:hypothetical protein